MLIVQNASRPAAMRHAIADLLARDVREVFISCAYMTLEASRRVLDEVEKFVGPVAIAGMPIRIVASLDFGLTAPEALTFWQGRPGATVHVAGAERLRQGSLQPRTSAYHPKVYAFRLRDGRWNLFAGSANMTTRGLSANTEAGLPQRRLADAKARLLFAQLAEGTEPLDAALLADYRRLRRRKPPPRQMKVEIEALPEPPIPAAKGLPWFGDAIANGTIHPEGESQMWFEAARTEGGGENQVEIARGGNRFFRFNYTTYPPAHDVIGCPVMVSGRWRWTDRKLAWHGGPGENKMERLNLPTRRQGGFGYANTAVLFRRLDDGSYEIVVAPWRSDLAKSWREASRRRGTLYRLGQRNTDRIMGFI